MDTFGGVLLVVFYAVTIAAACFFVHKVLWLVQYRRLQRRIVDEAVRRLREGNAAEVADWEDFARSCWAKALGHPEISGPSTFIRRVEEGLTQVRGDLRQNRRSVESLLVSALASGKGSSERRVPVLSLRRLTPGKRDPDESYDVTIDLAFPAVPVPRPPDKRLYELKVKSRYGFLRRALVFFSGAADVIYSSQHVALMSQNVHVPLSVLVRRLSLVFLIVLVVFLDMGLQIRKGISATIQEWLWPPVQQAAQRGLANAASDASLHDLLGTVLGFAVWLAVYGSIYLAVYFAIRRRYELNVRRLKSMLVDRDRAMEKIHRRHVSEVVRWGGAYGRSLDSAVEMTVLHAEQLIDHYAHRLRRRIAGPGLLSASKLIADGLFLKLPESKGELTDVATSQPHTLAHYVWPRAEEMGYQVRFAEYRAAWQHLELACADLRREQPDPVLAHELWRSATSYAHAFAPLVPTGMADQLREAYAQMVTECVAETDRDLVRLDRRLGELSRSLNEQLAAARGLVEGRVELTADEMAATVAALSAEVINVREQARLEAMAFEI
ncbi:Hypothetical protein A7982_00332 [Minicystis rosea]|nr:Hypothetical protein A7982_00332 [Minicystis rosea]